MVSPSHKYFTIFYFPLGDTAWFPFLHIGTVVHIHCILRIIVLYCMVSYSQSDLHTYFPIFFNSLYVSQCFTGAVNVCLVSVSTLVILRELSQLKGKRSF